MVSISVFVKSEAKKDEQIYERAKFLKYLKNMN